LLSPSALSMSEDDFLMRMFYHVEPEDLEKLYLWAGGDTRKLREFLQIELSSKELARRLYESGVQLMPEDLKRARVESQEAVHKAVAKFSLGDDFDPGELMREAAEKKLDPSVFADMDFREIPKAKNIIDWITNRQFLDAAPFPRQVQFLLALFEEWCFYCSDAEFVKDIHLSPYIGEDGEHRRAWTLDEILERVQLTEHGVCPKCHATYHQTLADPDAPHCAPNDFALCLGQRCVGANTIVPTNQGLSPISRLVPRREPDTFYPTPGLEVASGEGGSLSAESSYYSGVRSAIQIEAECGFSLEASLIHPVLVLRDDKQVWVKASDLNVGDALVVYLGDNVWGDKAEISNQEAYEMGAKVARDPTYWGKREETIFQHRPSVVEAFLRGLQVTKVKNTADSPWSRNQKTTSERVISTPWESLARYVQAAYINMGRFPFVTRKDGKFVIYAGETATEGEWFVRVTSTRFIGDRHLFDFHVPEKHRFVGNGLINHNSGKSRVAEFISSYQNHRFQMLAPTPQRHFGEDRTQQFTAMFTALDLAQSADTLWGNYHIRLQTAPWFKKYHEWLDYHGKKIGVEMYRIKDTYHSWVPTILQDRLKPPFAKAMRGRTGYMMGIDEIGMFAKAENSVRANAEEVFTAMNNTLFTLREASDALNRKAIHTPTALMICVSSPWELLDKIMGLIRGAKDNPRRVAFHFPTWECVAPDTLVLTPEGPLPIGNIAQEEGLRPEYSRVHLGSKNSFGSISHAFRSPKERYVRTITTESGNNLTASLDHRILSIQDDGRIEFTKMMDLNPEDTVLVSWEGLPEPQENSPVPGSTKKLIHRLYVRLGAERDPMANRLRGQATVYDIRTHLAHLERSYPTAFHRNSAQVEELREYFGPYIFTKIFSITEGKSVVCDITVPGDHQYWSNGFISHNCNPKIFRDSKQVVTEYAEDPVKADRDWAAIPPLADNPFHQNTAALDQILEDCRARKPLFVQGMKTGQSRAGQHYVYAVPNQLQSDRSIPRMMTIDAGEVNNSFALSIWSVARAKSPDVMGAREEDLGYEEEEDEDVRRILALRDEYEEEETQSEGSKGMSDYLNLDGIIEVIPFKDQAGNHHKVNFKKMYDLCLLPLVRSLNVKLLVADRWNMASIFDGLRDEGVDCHHFTLKWKDFIDFKQKLSSREVQLLGLEKPYESIFDDYERAIFNAPNLHLVVQTKTVRRTGRQVVKPKGGTDDLYRTMVLAHRFAMNDDPKDQACDPKGDPYLEVLMRYGPGVHPLNAHRPGIGVVRLRSSGRPIVGNSQVQGVGGFHSRTLSGRARKKRR